MLVALKAPKQIRGMRTINVELVSTENFMCPVSAMEKFLRFTEVRKEDPVAMFKERKLITKKKFNETLRLLLQGEVDYVEKKVSSHSFRSGVVTIMAQLGYNDEELKRFGRWNSDSVNNYIKEGRAQRTEESIKIAREMAKMVL